MLFPRTRTSPSRSVGRKASTMARASSPTTISPAIGRTMGVPGSGAGSLNKLPAGSGGCGSPASSNQRISRPPISVIHVSPRPRRTSSITSTELTSIRPVTERTCPSGVSATASARYHRMPLGLTVIRALSVCALIPNEADQGSAISRTASEIGRISAVIASTRRHGRFQ